MDLQVTLRYFSTTLAILLAATPAFAQKSLQDRLFQRALEARKCNDFPRPAGRYYCTYKFGEILEIGIKDVGGPDTVIGLHYSNIKNELYAVIYFGCVAVVPGQAHPKNYDLDYGVFISPRTGDIYRKSSECQASLK